MRSTPLVLATVMVLLGGLSILVAGPIWSFAAAIGIVLLLILIARPGALVFVAMLGFAANQALLAELTIPVGGSQINVSQVFMVVLSGLMALRLGLALASERNLPKPQSGHVMHLIFFLWCLSSVSWSHGEDARAAAGRVLACVIAHYFGYWLGRRDEHWIPLTIGVTAIIAGITAAVDAARGIGPVLRLTIGAVRAAGSFGGPVATATVAFVGLPVFTWYWMRKGPKHWKLFAAIGFAAVACAAVFTLTRTLILGILLFGFFFLMITFGSQRIQGAWRVVVSAIPVLLILGSLQLAPEQYINARTQDLPGSGEGFGSEAGSGRGLIWGNTLRMQGRSTGSEWAIGHGITSVREDLFQLIHLRKDAHNSYLQVLYDLGLVGVAIFLTLQWCSFRNLARARGDSPHASLLRDIWLAYFLAYLLSTIMFNGYVYAVGPRWLTYLGIGFALGFGSRPSQRQVTS